MSVLMIEYPGCVQYTTCSKPYYPSNYNPNVRNSSRCWTMYCNAPNGTTTTIACYFDDGKDDIQLNPPYSIWDMTAFDIFIWRYQPNPVHPEKAKVSYVNSTNEQRLFVDSKLVIPQISPNKKF